MLLRVAAGITTGAFALCIAQPTDLVKIRMQSTSGRYEGCLHAYRTIVRDETVRGLWKGLSLFIFSSFLGDYTLLFVRQRRRSVTCVLSAAAEVNHLDSDAVFRIDSIRDWNKSV